LPILWSANINSATSFPDRFAVRVVSEYFLNLFFNLLLTTYPRIPNTTIIKISNIFNLAFKFYLKDLTQRFRNRFFFRQRFKKHQNTDNTQHNDSKQLGSMDDYRKNFRLGFR